MRVSRVATAPLIFNYNPALGLCQAETALPVDDLDCHRQSDRCYGCSYVELGRKVGRQYRGFKKSVLSVPGVKKPWNTNENTGTLLAEMALKSVSFCLKAFPAWATAGLASVKLVIAHLKDSCV